MKRIDAHQHFWSLSRFHYAWPTPDLTPIYRDFAPEDLAPLLHESGIDATVLIQVIENPEETKFFLEIAEKTPWVSGVVGWIDMSDPAQIPTLNEFAAYPKFCGIRPMIQSISERNWMLRPELDACFKRLIELDLTFDALVLPTHLAPLYELLQRYPELKCVIDHGAKPEIRNTLFQSWADDIARIADDTSSYCKLSGLVTEASSDWKAEDLRPYMEHLLASFGPNRLMFGSDWPVVNLASNYRAWIELVTQTLSTLCKTDQDQIWGGNAATFYKLSC